MDDDTPGTGPHGGFPQWFGGALPLQSDGLIDEQEYRTHPELATARRFWPNEPDRRGYLLRTPEGWVLSYARGEEDDERIFRLDAHSVRPGSYLTLTEPDGAQLPFLVKGLAPA